MSLPLDSLILHVHDKALVDFATLENFCDGFHIHPLLGMPVNIFRVFKVKVTKNQTFEYFWQCLG